MSRVEYWELYDVSADNAVAILRVNIQQSRLMRLIVFQVINEFPDFTESMI
jgi:hypothetical protein